MQEKLARHCDEIDGILHKAKIEFDMRMREKITSRSGIGDFNIQKTLGHGAFGRVFLVKHKTKDTDRYHAVKVIEKKHIIETKQLAHSKAEIRLLYAAKSDFIVTLEDYFKNNVYIFLVMPFVSGGDLFVHLREHKRFEESLSKFYAAQVILAFEYMHHMGLVYRDLKPENILIEKSGYIKVTDFGFCKKIDDQRTYTLCGTPDYISPEAILSQGYNNSVDWWALGVLIFEMVAGYPPFYSNNPMKTYEKIVAGKFVCPPYFSRALKDIVCNILQVDRSKRYGLLRDGVKDVKSHSWFITLDWADLYHRKLNPTFKPKVEFEDDTSNFMYQSEDIFRENSINEYSEEFSVV